MTIMVTEYFFNFLCLHVEKKIQIEQIFFLEFFFSSATLQRNNEIPDQKFFGVEKR